MASLNWNITWSVVTCFYINFNKSDTFLGISFPEKNISRCYQKRSTSVTFFTFPKRRGTTSVFKERVKIELFKGVTKCVVMGLYLCALKIPAMPLDAPMLPYSLLYLSSKYFLLRLQFPSKEDHLTPFRVALVWQVVQDVERYP